MRNIGDEMMIIRTWCVVVCRQAPVACISREEGGVADAGVAPSSQLFGPSFSLQLLIKPFIPHCF